MIQPGDTNKNINSLYRRIAAPIIESAPPGWTVLHQTDLQVGKSGGSSGHAVMNDGSEVYLRGGSFDAHDALMELREALYQPGRGAWYTSRCTITDSGTISIDFDYDNEPQWDIDIVPATYVEDLEMFPRDLEHQPDWLREKLRQAGA